MGRLNVVLLYPLLWENGIHCDTKNPFNAHYYGEDANGSKDVQSVFKSFMIVAAFLR